ncbi:MAG TPA: helix-turn-helix domain-containing protein [Marinobacter sp.]|uniref:Helix-turn-helix domain-containing protein n=1 Tax=Marinobacter antarcticus TaxID=564117 RepID=A0A831W053_9GAMM|nr:helix-turn-helix domain-containing protein [Marinobacter sp.]HEA53160.1 helix-turn-helix domain-containing protein [Marinobacter antarcticus]
MFSFALGLASLLCPNPQPLLTRGSRYQVLAWMNAGRSLRQIAQTLGCHSSTVSCELKRS